MNSPQRRQQAHTTAFGQQRAAGPACPRAAWLPAPAVAQVNCYLSKAAVAVAPGKVLITAQHPLN